MSLVIHSENISGDAEILRISKILKKAAKISEIVVVASHGINKPDLGLPETGIPMTTVYTRIQSSLDDELIAGLSRAVGDYVILWSEKTQLLDEKSIHSLIEPSNLGFEVSLLTVMESKKDKNFFQILNLFRDEFSKISPLASYCFSRQALNMLLNEARFEPHFEIVVANIPFTPFIVDPVQIQPSTKTLAFGKKLALISRSTNLGITAPLLLAIMSGVMALFIAFYAVIVFLVSGKSPEGWTTLMVALGLSQSSVLSVLVFILAKLNALEKVLKRNDDVTAYVEVFANVEIEN